MSLRGVIFDLDGTLVDSRLDFDAMGPQSVEYEQFYVSHVALFFGRRTVYVDPTRR